MNQPLHEARAHTLFKLQTETLTYSHRYTTFSSENNTLLCGNFYGYHHHQNRLGHMLKPPNKRFEASVFVELKSVSKVL